MKVKRKKQAAVIAFSIALGGGVSLVTAPSALADPGTCARVGEGSPAYEGMVFPVYNRCGHTIKVRVNDGAGRTSSCGKIAPKATKSFLVSTGKFWAYAQNC
ncbi:hypothetical protein ABT294_29165 [Nonomuraea sp. NPDC000554]|uniref:hypothetical protein n=1 Tax=Nonomuraea sp. NPDC000554 TaxID=3154259 RepID=UPI00332D412D